MLSLPFCWLFWIFFFFHFWPPCSISSSLARDQIQAAVATYSATVATSDPLTHSAGLGIEPASCCCRDTAHPVVPQRGFLGFVFVVLFSSLPLLRSSLVWWLSLVFSLDCFFFSMCVFFVDTMRFGYNSLCIYKIVLSGWSLDFICFSNILQSYSPHDCWFWCHISVWMISYL